MLCCVTASLYRSRAVDRLVVGTAVGDNRPAGEGTEPAVRNLPVVDDGVGQACSALVAPGVVVCRNHRVVPLHTGYAWAVG